MVSIVMNEKAIRALDRAIGMFGSVRALAREIGFSPNSIPYWKHHGKKGVPGEACVAIERVTSGQVRAKDLRPDLYP